MKRLIYIGVEGWGGGTMLLGIKPATYWPWILGLNSLAIPPQPLCHTCLLSVLSPTSIHLSHKLIKYITSSKGDSCQSYYSVRQYEHVICIMCQYHCIITHDQSNTTKLTELNGESVNSGIPGLTPLGLGSLRRGRFDFIHTRFCSITQAVSLASQRERFFSPSVTVIIRKYHNIVFVYTWTVVVAPEKLQWQLMDDTGFLTMTLSFLANG